MMTLFYSPTSPFVRKVLVYASELGQEKHINRVRAVVSPSQPNEALAAHNPLMKVPTLIDRNGDAIFGSGPICAYLETCAADPGPVETAQDTASLTLIDLCDGMMETGVAMREDDLRFGQRGDDAWQKGQALKIKQGVAFLNRRLDKLCASNLLAKVTAAVALEWLIFREFHKPSLVEPGLQDWLERVSQWESMLSTRPVPDAHTAITDANDARSKA